MPPIYHFVLGLLLSVVLDSPIFVDGGNVLVIAQDTDAWLDMRHMVEKMQEKGHKIVLVIPRNTMITDSSESLTVKMYEVPLLKTGLSINLDPIPDQSVIGILLGAVSTDYRRMQYTASILSRTCLDLLADKELLSYLERRSFDVALMDPVFPCGPILAEHLHLSSIYILPLLPCGWDSKVAGCLTSDTFKSDKALMGFVQRVLATSFEYFVCKELEAEYTKVASPFLHREVKLLQIFSQAELWLYRYDFILEPTKPIMPKMVLIGGHNCVKKPSEDKEFKALVDSSGEHGFVVFSLGSMVSEIPKSKAMDIAEALRSIPQTVIWRYTGPVPSNLGNNTHLVKWLPQNDLLAHPKARAFITHAGSHGLYEGICNAVPMVMLPLFGDQMDNAKRIESRGAGITLNVLDMTPEDLSNALHDVINNPSYMENIKRMSALHLDRPMHPLDLAVYWVEFVMRHKGAPHLRPAAHDLNWIQYNSIDVIGFLLAVLFTTLFISFKCCCFAYRRCCGTKTKPKSKSKKE